MWIYTPSSALSVVAHRDDPNVLLVRSRDINDLILFLLPQDMDRIQHTPAADYPYRALMTRDAFADTLSDFVRMELDYSNVKGETHALATHGLVSQEKVRQMHRVYHATLPVPVPMDWDREFEPSPYREDEIDLAYFADIEDQPRRTKPDPQQRQLDLNPTPSRKRRRKRKKGRQRHHPPPRPLPF